MKALYVIEQALGDSRPAVQQAALHAVRVAPSSSAALHDRLVRLLQTGTPAVRREAATAIGAVGDTAAVGELLRSVARSDNDRLLEHALIYALIELGDYMSTSQGLAHSDLKVRRAALIAMDQMEHSQLTADVVVPLLDTEDDALQRAAMKVIASRSDWGHLIA